MREGIHSLEGDHRVGRVRLPDAARRLGKVAVIDEVISGLSDALDDVDDLAGASFAVEPHPGAASDELTEPDQPL